MANQNQENTSLSTTAYARSVMLQLNLELNTAITVMSK